MVTGSARPDDQAAGAAGRARVEVDPHRVALADVAGQQLLGQLVADRGLHQPAQRPRPVHRVEAVHGQPLPAGVGDLQGEPALGQPPAQHVELDVDDVRELLGGQRVEHHHVVEPVEELRLEVPLHDRHHRVPPAPVVQRRVGDGLRCPGSR